MATFHYFEDIVVKVEATRLSYRLSDGFKLYQILCGLGIAGMSAWAGFWIRKEQPLNDLLDSGPSWNIGAVAFCFLFSGCLLLGIFFFRRSAGLDFVLEGDPVELSFCKKVCFTLEAPVRKCMFKCFQEEKGQLCIVFVQSIPNLSILFRC